MLLVALAAAALVYLPREGKQRRDPLMGGAEGVMEEGPAAEIVLISVDALRKDALGCYGNPGAYTPEIDRLARMGEQFARPVSPSNWTTPAMLSVLTGRDPELLGTWKLYAPDGTELKRRSVLPRSIPSLAECLSAAGYRTAAFTSGGNLKGALGFARGFEHYAEYFSNEGLRKWVDEHGDASWESMRRWLEEHLPGVDLEEMRRQYEKGMDNSAVRSWLEGVLPGERFFLWLHFIEPHWPYEPPAPFARVGAMGTGLSLEDRRLEDVPPDLARIGGAPDRGPGVSPEGWRLIQALYQGEVAYTDRLVGEILRALAARNGGSRRSRLVAFTADHGEEFGDHGFSGHGGNQYAEVTDVPLIIRRGEGRRRLVGAVVTTRRLHRRILEAANAMAACAPTPTPGSEATSRVRALQAAPPILSKGGGYDEIAFRLGRYKAMIRRPQIGSDEQREPWIRAIYDTLADPLEQHDIKDSRPELKRRFLQALAGHDARIRDEMALLDEEDDSLTLDEHDRSVLRSLGYVE
jgi:arylsulfatase